MKFSSFIITLSKNKKTIPLKPINTPVDFNSDNFIGDKITHVLASSTENSKGLNNWGLYKTKTDSYILDIANKSLGEETTSPMLLTKIIRNKSYLYKFQYLPDGAVVLNDSINVYYKDNRDRWYKDTFDSSGKFESKVLYDLNQVLADELTYNIDLNKDGHIGDVVDSIKSSSNVDGEGHQFSLYQTVSKAYVFDKVGIDIGDRPGDNGEAESGSNQMNPTFLKKQIYKRGVLNEIMHKFNYDPSGLLAYDSGDFEVFYKDSKKRWFADKFDKDGVYKGSNGVSLSELLVNESKYKVDLNDDGAFGDIINQKIFTSTSSDYGLYKTSSGSLVIDVNTLNIGEYTDSPTLLTYLRGDKYYIRKYRSVYEINGVIKYEDSEDFSLFFEYRNSIYKTNYNSDGVYQGMEYYKNVSLLLND